METFACDINEILKIMPHRYPFLMVDRVTHLKPWESITAYKNVSFNEPFFTGHFPQRPVMPGVMIIEAMGQAAALFIALSAKSGVATPDGTLLPTLDGRIAFFAGVDKVKFRRQVIPGDQLEMEVSLLRLGTKFWKVKSIAKVGGQKVAEAEMMSALVEDSGE